MKIDATKFAKLIEKSIISYAAVPNFKIEILEEGLSIKCKSVDNLIAIKSLIKINKVDIPSLCISDSKFFIDSLKLFTGDTYLKVEGNILKIYNENKEIDLPLAAEDFIDTKIDDIPVINGMDSKLTLKKTFLNNIQKNVELLKTQDIYFKVENNVLIVEVGDEGFTKVREKESVECNDVIARFGPVITEVFSVIDEKAIINLGFNRPMKITEKIDDIELEILIAPKKIEAKEDSSQESVSSTKENENKEV